MKPFSLAPGEAAIVPYSVAGSVSLSGASDRPFNVFIASPAECQARERGDSESYTLALRNRTEFSIQIVIGSVDWRLVLENTGKETVGGWFSVNLV